MHTFRIRSGDAAGKKVPITILDHRFAILVAYYAPYPGKSSVRFVPGLCEVNPPGIDSEYVSRPHGIEHLHLINPDSTQDGNMALCFHYRLKEYGVRRRQDPQRRMPGPPPRRRGRVADRTSLRT
jgi:hypothetical protein